MEKLSKYLEDDNFIHWVFSPNEELEAWWLTFETENPQEKQSILSARKILYCLQTNNKQLTDEEKIHLFTNILKQIEEKQEKRAKLRVFLGLLKYAAVAVLFFAAGALLFYRFDNHHPQLYTQKMEESFSGDVVRLIRPDGESIVFDEPQSHIEHRADGRVIANSNVLSPSQPTKKDASALNQLIVPFGKTSEIVLPDGTKVYLNAGSRLIYPDTFVNKNREVFLSGEAFFEVNHDSKHPFVCQTSDIRIKALGTKFNVSAYPSDNMIETVLTEGKVRLEHNNTNLFDESIDMIPSQLAEINKTDRQVKLYLVDTDNYTLWKDQLLKFESADLSRVIKKLERYYNIHFIYADPMLGVIKISGKLELDENRDEIINRVAVAAAVKIKNIGNDDYEIGK
ncbi:MAG: FecR domain-containing protein [Dysgonamonadaceae bacterium]|jgi:hypothetical protein|nr:FecR domain-containing protein [Dysgonamonadaceae bacterium]